MYRVFWSRALVVLGVLAGSFLLGRFLASTASYETAIETAQAGTVCEVTHCCEMGEKVLEMPSENPAPSPTTDAAPAAPPIDVAHLCLPGGEVEAVAEQRDEMDIYIPPCPEARSEAPAFMPYIESEEAEAPPAKTAKDSSCPCCADREKKAQPSKGAPDVSRYEPLFPNPGNDEVPARSKVDTMDFRPSDARRGAFDPQPL